MGEDADIGSPTGNAAGSTNTPVIATDRFVMRPLRASDTALLLPTFQDEATMRYMPRQRFGSERELRDWLFDPTWDGRTWIAEDAGSRTAGARIAGRFVAVPTDRADVVEVGCVTTLEFRRRGVARECLSHLIAYLMDEEDERSVIAEIDADNAASIRLFERLGFERTGLREAAETTHLGARTMLDYVLTALGNAAGIAAAHG